MKASSPLKKHYGAARVAPRPPKYGHESMIGRAGCHPGRVFQRAARDLDKAFDAGKNISPHLDLARGKRVNQTPKRVNVDFPIWMIHSLDREANRLGVTRQSIIKVWISERLQTKSA
jgi:hypothetical protein